MGSSRFTIILPFFHKFGGPFRGRLAKALLPLAYAPRWLAATRSRQRGAFHITAP